MTISKIETSLPLPDDSTRQLTQIEVPKKEVFDAFKMMKRFIPNGEMERFFLDEHERLTMQYLQQGPEVPKEQRILSIDDESLPRRTLNEIYEQIIQFMSDNRNLLLDITYITFSAIDLTYLSVQISLQMSFMSNLQALDLSHNQLSYLPEEIGNFQNLQVLSLHDNQFSIVPEEIRKLKKLARLYLGFNQIKKLPEWIGELKELKSLRLDYNQLTECSEIGKCRGLLYLNLSYNQITERPIELEEEYRSKSKVNLQRRLVLDGNPFTKKEPVESKKSPKQDDNK